MAMSTVASSASAVCLLLYLTCIISIVSAEVATTSPMQTLPDYYEPYTMGLTLTSASGPVQIDYKVAPLTAEAGLNQTNQNTLEV